jgi:hypothetical protein
VFAGVALTLVAGLWVALRGQREATSTAPAPGTPQATVPERAALRSPEFRDPAATRAPAPKDEPWAARAAATEAESAAARSAPRTWYARVLEQDTDVPLTGATAAPCPTNRHSWKGDPVAVAGADGLLRLELGQDAPPVARIDRRRCARP